MNEELYHHGILGQKWGIRRYQNPDGTLTEAGKKREQRKEKIKEFVNNPTVKKVAKISAKIAITGATMTASAILVPKLVNAGMVYAVTSGAATNVVNTILNSDMATNAEIINKVANMTGMSTAEVRLGLEYAKNNPQMVDEVVKQLAV